MWTVFVQPRRRGVFGGTMLEVPKELSKSIRGMTREVQKTLFLVWKRVFDKKKSFLRKMTFLTIKKRLRQAAGRGKWCFSQRNAIFASKKSPAASRQPKEIVFFLKKRYFGPKKKRLRQASSRRKMVLVLPNKGAIGSPQQRSHWFTPTKEPLVHPKKEPLVHSNKGATPSGEKQQKHKNLHKTVIRRTFRARS